MEVTSSYILYGQVNSHVMQHLPLFSGPQKHDWWPLIQSLKHFFLLLSHLGPEELFLNKKNYLFSNFSYSIFKFPCIPTACNTYLYMKYNHINQYDWKVIVNNLKCKKNLYNKLFYFFYKNYFILNAFTQLGIIFC